MTEPKEPTCGCGAKAGQDHDAKYQGTHFEPKEQLRPEGVTLMTMISCPTCGTLVDKTQKSTHRSPEVDGKWEKLRELYEWIKLVHKDWVNTGKFEKAYACEYILNYIESVATVAILKTGSSTVPTRDAERGKP